jgi:hypothetical protein
MSVIKQSDEYELGYSQRVTLQKELVRQVDKVSTQMGMRPRELTETILDPDGHEQDTLIEIVQNAIDAIQASKSELTAERLKAKYERPDGR